MPRSNPRRAAVAALLVAAGAAPELALRAARGTPPSEERWLEEARYELSESKKPFFARTRNGGVEMAEPNRPRSTAVGFPVEKKPGEIRAFLVGESVAQRLAAPDLSARLTAALGVSRATVINCGMGAYGSARVGGVLREVLDYKPDLLLVMTGNNDGVSAERGWYPLYRTNLFLRRSWSWRLLQDAATRLVSRPEGPAARDARFEANLRSMLRAAKASGVPAVVATLPVNLRDYPPLGELPVHRPDFLAGWRALEAGLSGPAVAAFRREAASRPADAMTRFGLGRALSKSGDESAAGAEFARAVEADFPDRCTPTRNELIRRVAAEEGAFVADLEREFRGRAPGGAPGWDAFADGVHWRHGLDPAADEVLARAARIALRSSGKDGVMPVLPSAWDQKEARELALRALSDAVQLADEPTPPVLVERVVAEFVQADAADAAGLRTLLADAGATEAEFAKNEWTRFLSGRVRRGWPTALAHAGEALARRGKTVEALARFAEASRLDPAAGLPPFLAGKTLLNAGRAAEAARAWDSIPPDTRERAMVGFYRSAR